MLLDAALRQLVAASRESEDALTKRFRWRRSGCSPRSAAGPAATPSWSKGQDGHRGHIVLTDDAGAVLAELTGVELSRSTWPACRCRWSRRSSTPPGCRARRTHGGAVADGTWVVLAESDPETTLLAANGHGQAHLVDPACGQRHAGR